MVLHPVPAAGVGAAGQRARLSRRRARGSIQRRASVTSRLEVWRRKSRKGLHRAQGSPCQGSRDLPVPRLCVVESGEGGPGAHRDSCRDTNWLQNSGVIWRGSSGRMLMESSARPQSRHSMVYSCGGTGEGGDCHSHALPQPCSGHSQGNPSRNPILDCNQTWGGSHFVPQDEPHRLP